MFVRTVGGNHRPTDFMRQCHVCIIRAVNTARIIIPPRTDIHLSALVCLNGSRQNWATRPPLLMQLGQLVNCWWLWLQARAPGRRLICVRLLCCCMACILYVCYRVAAMRIYSRPIDKHIVRCFVCFAICILLHIGGSSCMCISCARRLELPRKGHRRSYCVL